MTALQGNGVAFTIASGTSSSLFQINAPISGNTTYTFSVYIRAQTGTFTGVRLRLNDGTTATLSSTFTVTTEWTRFSLTVTSVAGATVMSALVGTTGFPADLYIWGAQLEVGSAATVYIPTAAVTSGAARFDYDPVTLAPKGLLIEESRTNLLTYSEQFDNAAWSKGNTTVTANAVVSPDGTMDGDKLVEDTATSQHSAQQGGTLSAAGASTFSVYLKAGERQFVQVWLHDTATTGNRVEGYVNLTTGVVSSVQSVGTGWTAASIVVTSVGNGWLRVSLTGTSTVTAISARVRIASAVGTTTYTGDGTSGIYIWGAQLEAGVFATSYIPTVASQVTRAADLAVMTGTNFSSWYNATEGTWFADFTPPTSDYLTNKNLFLASDNTTSNFNGLRYVTSGSRPGLGVTAAGTTQASIATTAMVANTAYKMAGAYKLNDFAVSRNGAAVVTDANGTLPTVTQAEIGSLAGSVNVLGSQHIRRLAYYNRRLTNAELQGITA